MRLARFLLVFAAGALVLAGCDSATAPNTQDTQSASEVQSQAVNSQSSDVSWESVGWSFFGNGSATVNPDGNLEVTTGSNGNGGVFVDDLGSLESADTPWVVFSYKDNLGRAGIDAFLNWRSGDARISAGSLFSFSCLLFTRYGPPAAQEAIAGGCNVPAPSQKLLDTPVDRIDGKFGDGETGDREEGREHVLYIGQRSDGTVDFNFDGQWFTSTLFPDDGVSSANFGDVLLRLRDEPGSTATFTGFAYGTDHSGRSGKDKCKKGGWKTNFSQFDSQGECVSFFAGGNRSRGQGPLGN